MRPSSLYMPLTFPVLILLVIFSISGHTKPLVIASIKPAQLLVTAIADDLVDAQVLLPATVSPHLYHLRPSERQRLQSADLVFWIGPDLERFLIKTLSLLPDANVVELGRTFVGRSLAAEQSVSGERFLRERPDEPDAEHNHQAHDPHLWLDPIHAVQMAGIIAERLSVMDPVNQESYKRNLRAFQQRIKQLDAQIRAGFQSLQGQRYVVLHDAYGHFERRYGLQHVAAITTTPERKPGVKHVLAIRQQIQRQGVHCVFREPQYQLSSGNIINAMRDVNVGLLDPLASTVAVSKTGYETFLLSFSEQFQRCLKKRD